MAIIKCYSGGREIHKINATANEYEAEEGCVTVYKNEQAVFFWSGSFSVESSELDKKKPTRGGYRYP